MCNALQGLEIEPEQPIPMKTKPAEGGILDRIKGIA